MAVTAKQWADDLLGSLKIKPTQPDEQFIENWLPREGTKAVNNPMATTLGSAQSGVSVPGSTNFNSAGVQNYPTYASGLGATASTLKESRYSAITGALASGNPYTYGNQGALESEFATWSGSGYSSVTSGTSPNYVSPGLANSSSSGKLANTPAPSSSNNPAKPARTTSFLSPLLGGLTTEQPAPTLGPSWLPWNWGSDAVNSVWRSVVPYVVIAAGLIVAIWGLKIAFERNGAGAPGGGGGGEPVMVNVEHDAEHAGEAAAAA